MINIYSSDIIDIIMDSIEKPPFVKDGYHLEPNITVYAENGYLRYNAYWEVVKDVE